MNHTLVITDLDSVSGQSTATPVLATRLRRGVCGVLRPCLAPLSDADPPTLQYLRR